MRSYSTFFLGAPLGAPARMGFTASITDSLSLLSIDLDSLFFAGLPLFATPLGVVGIGEDTVSESFERRDPFLVTFNSEIGVMMGPLRLERLSAFSSFSRLAAA